MLHVTSGNCGLDCYRLSDRRKDTVAGVNGIRLHTQTGSCISFGIFIPVLLHLTVAVELIT